MLKHKSFFLLYAYSCILCIGALTLSCCSSGDESPNAPTELNLQEDNISSIMQNSESSSSNKDNEFSSSEMTIEQNSSSEIKENSCSSVTQNSISSSSNIDHGLSSNGETIEQSSSSEIVERKSKFVISEMLTYVENSHGNLYLSDATQSSNYVFLSDTSYSYEQESTIYNMDGTVITQSTVKIEKIVAKDTPFDIYHKCKTIVDGELLEDESLITYTIEFLGSTEEGLEYKYIGHQNGMEINTSTKYILDRDGFVKKMIYYDYNNIPDSTVYSRLPNAPNELYNLSLCPQYVFNTPSYEYYNVSCKDIVNTQDIYQVEIKTSYKLKNSDQEYNWKRIYTFKQIFY